MAEKHPDELVLLSYVEEELDDPAHREVAEHLVACPTCAQQIRRLHEGREALRSAPLLELPDDRHAEILSTLPEHTERWRLFQPVKRALVVAAPVAAAAALVGVFVLAGTQLGGGGDNEAGGDTAGGEAAETRAAQDEAGAGGGQASCAPAVSYRGHLYIAHGVEVVPPEGRPLLTGIVPDCADTGEEPGPGTEVQLAPIEGVPADIALLQHGVADTVFVRAGFQGPLPPELRRTAPACDPRDEPIQLAGRWLGIFGRDDPTTEADLASPYDVKLFVAESSAPRYERAYLVVRVPRGLERPLTPADLNYLWDGTIELTVVCRDGRYLARDVAVHPPD